MHTLPFQDVAEARSTAIDFHESLKYFEVLDQSGKPLQWQATLELLGRAYRCKGWVDLCGRLDANRRIEYYAPRNFLELDLAPYQALAQTFTGLLGGGADLQDRLLRALHRCAPGCHPHVREEVLKLRLCVGFTARQLGELMEVDRWRAYHGRYDNRRNAYEIHMLDYAANRRRAEILGTKLPTRPQPPRSKRPAALSSR